MANDMTTTLEGREIWKYLIFGSQHAEPPKWMYSLLIARYLKITPEAAETISEDWRERILLFMSVEKEAQEHRDEKARRLFTLSKEVPAEE